MHFDVVLIGDFRVPGGTSRQASNQIRALHSAGYSVGLITVELPHAKGRKPIDPLIRARLSMDEAVLIHDGLEDLSASLVIFENPRAFQEPPANAIQVDAARAIITVHFPLIDGAGQRTFDPEAVTRVCATITDAPLLWAPVSDLTRRLLAEGGGDLPMLDRNLPNIVVAEEFEAKRTRPVKDVPVIGRHSRPQPDKWPPTRKEMFQVYPRAADIEVALLGAGDNLRQLVGAYPRNWRTYEFNEIAPDEFLRGIDFFVYFHHPNWIEAFGIATAEAMASGAVAILPPYMKENFGDAAVYCELKEAAATVRALYGDWQSYLRQSRKGTSYVRKHLSAAAYLKVVEPLIGPARNLRRQDRTRLSAMQRFDVAIMADMSRAGSPARRIAAEVDALAASRYRTVLLHLPQGPASGRVRPEIDLLLQHGLAAAADPWAPTIKAPLLVIHCPQSLIANLPRLRLPGAPRHIVVVVDAPFAGGGQISLTDRLLRATGAKTVTWAPAHDFARIWLEERAPGVRISSTNWRPVTPPLATKPRSVQRKTPVVAVVDLSPGETGTGEMQRALMALPRDGSVSVRLYGAPDENAIKQLPQLTGWELFKSFQMDLGKMLDRADFLICLGGEQQGTVPDVAAAEAAARGLPVIASPALRRHFGAGAIYSPASGMMALVRKLHRSPRDYRAASKASLAHAVRAHAPQALRQRIAAAIGEPPATKAASRKSAGKTVTAPRVKSGRRRIMMFSQNGVGLGHVVRQLAISRHLSTDHDVLFCSMSQAYDVISAYGYQVEYLPSHVYTGVEYVDWHAWARDQIEQMIDFYDAGAVVLDGSVPYLGLLDAVAPRPDVRLVWIRRPMWRPSPESLLRIAQQRFFDLIIEPAELAGEADRGPTVAHRDRCVCVEPIRLLDERELLTRAQAAAALRLDPARPAVLIQLGSGANRDIVGLTDRILDAARRFDGLQVVVAEWLNSAEALDLWDDVPCLSGFPISRYFRAFDFSVSAAGYNSFHEVLSYGLPTLFIGNPRKYMDDQGARATFAAQRGAALESGTAPREIAAAMARMMDQDVRRAMAAAARSLSRPNGAKAAADAIRRSMSG